MKETVYIRNRAGRIYKGTLTQKQTTGKSLSNFLRLYGKYFNGKMTYRQLQKKNARAIRFALYHR